MHKNLMESPHRAGHVVHLTDVPQYCDQNSTHLRAGLDCQTWLFISWAMTVDFLHWFLFMSVPPFAYYVLLPALQRIMINHSDVLLTIIMVYIDKQQAL